MLPKMSKEEVLEAIRQGTYDAFFGLLTDFGNFPISRDFLLEAVEEGVKKAFEKHPIKNANLSNSNKDIFEITPQGAINEFNEKFNSEQRVYDSYCDEWTGGRCNFNGHFLFAITPSKKGCYKFYLGKHKPTRLHVRTREEHEKCKQIIEQRKHQMRQ